MTHSFCYNRLQKCRDLENRVKGPWRSLKMSSFDRDPITSYWCSIVTMALSHVVSEILNVEKYRDLEIPVKNQSRSLKLVPFDTLDTVLLVFYSNFVHMMHRFWDIWLQISQKRWIEVDRGRDNRAPSQQLWTHYVQNLANINGQKRHFAG